MNGISAQKDSFEALYGTDLSERQKRLGRLAEVYNIPKYAGLFTRYCAYKGASVLELGAGSGDISEAVVRSGVNKDLYCALEETVSGTDILKKKGFQAIQGDAQALPFRDNAFDIVCAFDVMHHVSMPRLMAAEMSRVAAKEVFLIEANGVCLVRKILEQTAYYKKFGEKSYTSRQYLEFFKGFGLTGIVVKPFLFTPPAVPELFIKPVIAFSEFMERLPLLRWQCSGLVIWGRIQKERE